MYSLRGHQIADIDPLGLMQRPMPGVLKLDYLGLNEGDMDTEFYTGGLAGIELGIWSEPIRFLPAGVSISSLWAILTPKSRIP